MLALAVGLNATMFTVMNTMLFRGFPLVQENARLVYIQEHGPSGCCMSYPDFEVWRSRAQAFEGMAFVAERPVTFSDGGERSIRIVPFTVSANTFELLGVQPTLGRNFVPADEGPGAAPVAIINYRFWESRFGKRNDIVGSTVYFDGAPATIIGVMPEGFDFPTQSEIWMPLAHTPELHQRSGLAIFEDPGGYLTVARLRDGTDIEEARAELETINRSLEAEYPETTSRCCSESKDPFAVLCRPGCAHDLRLALGGGVVHLADRLRQPDQSRAGADRWPVARVFDQDCTRRGLGADDTPDSGGEPDDCDESLERSAGGSSTGACGRGPRQPHPPTRYSTSQWVPARWPIWLRSP